MKKLIFHIGMHKTGTTAIQKFCSDHREFLMEAGYYYPEISRPIIRSISYGHHLIPWFFKNHPVPPKYWREFADDKPGMLRALHKELSEAKQPNIIISSEEFDTLKPQQIEALVQEFSDYEIHAVIYLRRKDELVQALYQTEVVYSDQSATIHEYLEKRLERWNYATIIQNWQAAIRPDNFHVRIYHPSLFEGGDVLRDFFALLEIDVDEGLYGAAKDGVNASVPYQYAAVIAMLRRMDAPKDMTDLVKQIAYSVRARGVKSIPLLGYGKRSKLAESGAKEIHDTIPGLPYDLHELWTVTDDPELRLPKQQRFSALYSVLKDMKEAVKEQPS